MMEYNFCLKYQLSAGDRDADLLVERLGEAGCTDALVGIGTVGRLALDFSREAESAREAVLSALTELQSAIPSATLIEASPDLVGLTDIAKVMSVSRQAVRKLMISNHDFPAPVHEGSGSLWHLSDVLDWLVDRKGYALDQALRDIAGVTRSVNLAKEAKRYPHGATPELDRLLA